MSDFSLGVPFGSGTLYVGPTTDQVEHIKSSYNFKPKKVIANYPATIIIWNDDTKTIVKCSKDDNYDLRIGILLCFMKKLFGNNNNYHKILYDAIDNVEVQYNGRRIER